MAKTNAHQVANFFLWFAHQHGDLLSNLKLQKLVYYAQAWHLALRGEPLFDEPVQAWVHGPVVPGIYQRFRDFGWRPISVNPEKPPFDPDTEEHLVEVMRVYGGFSAYELELMTHQERPWLEARGDLPVDAPSNACISHQSMLEFYQALADTPD